MNEKEFFEQLRKHLAKPKQFVQNPARISTINKAITLAKSLFPDAEMELQDDPLEMGALILQIDTMDINISGSREMKNFLDFIALTDNFEIYALNNGDIRFAAVFTNALIDRLAQGK